MKYMSDFLAAPFTAMMYANAWLSGMISGRIIIIAMEEHRNVAVCIRLGNLRCCSFEEHRQYFSFKFKCYQYQRVVNVSKLHE